MEMLCIGCRLERIHRSIRGEQLISCSDRESCGLPQASDRHTSTASSDLSEKVADRPDERPGGHDWWRPDLPLCADFHQKVGEPPQIVQ